MGIIAQITYANTYTNNNGSANSDYADVYITLIDADTGQPTNGNNAIIGYLATENGISMPEEVRIPGQSILIYSGLINQSEADQFGNYTPYYSKTFTITSVSAIADPSPPVNICDLHITYVNIDQPESAPGAADAKITVYAASSFLPLLYSLDNISFQTSNRFNGLTGGLKTVYVTDANSTGCAVSQQITVPVLSSLLVNDPSVTIGGNVSRWSAAFNPIIFTYQRKDFEITAVTADSLTGFVKLSVNADVSKVMIDDMVYVNAGVYRGIFTVKALAEGALIIDTPYISTAAGYININRLRPYYKLLTCITYQDQTLGRLNNIVSVNRPDNTGLIKADISNFLQSIVQVKDESDFTKINFRDANLGASYKIAYAESWDNDTVDGYTSTWIPLAAPYYVIYAAKQLGDRYGGNLAAYVPYTTLTAGNAPAKWITDFSEPVYSNGYPFDIGFIYSEYLLGLNVYYKLTLLDINRKPLPGGSQTTALLNEDGTWLLNQNGSKFIIANQTNGTTALPEQLGLNRLLVNSNFPADAYYFVIGLYYRNTGALARFNYELTETLLPQFIDGDGHLSVNGTSVVDIYSAGSGTYNIQAGSNYSFEATLTEASLLANPTIRLTVTKNGLVIYDQRIPAIPGASMVKTGIAQPGATYHAVVTTEDTTEAITPIDIADDAPVIETEIQVVSDQVVRIDKAIDYNSVYLRWIGLSGAWNYYRFIFNQEVSLDVQNATIIKNYVTDWENQQGIEEVISKTAGQKIKVMAEDLSVNDIKGLQSIKYSPKVQMLISKNPVKWQTVVLNTATFSEYETLNGTAPFSVTFNLPSINIQTQ